MVRNDLSTTQHGDQVSVGKKDEIDGGGRKEEKLKER